MMKLLILHWMMRICNDPLVAVYSPLARMLYTGGRFVRVHAHYSSPLNKGEEGHQHSRCPSSPLFRTNVSSYAFSTVGPPVGCPCGALAGGFSSTKSPSWATRLKT